jgi:rRNA-processing protein FCF1
MPKKKSAKKKELTVQKFFNKQLSGEPLTEEAVVEALLKYANMHRKKILKKMQKLYFDSYEVDDLSKSYPKIIK